MTYFLLGLGLGALCAFIIVFLFDKKVTEDEFSEGRVRKDGVNRQPMTPPPLTMHQDIQRSFTHSNPPPNTNPPVAIKR